jgi:CheY-like chemotaxis protein
MIEESFMNHRRCMNHKPYQLVILDNYMPIMSGIETAQKLRNDAQLIIEEAEHANTLDEDII